MEVTQKRGLCKKFWSAVKTFSKGENDCGEKHLDFLSAIYALQSVNDLNQVKLQNSWD